MAQAKYEIRRKCPICGAVFQIRTIDAVYCSKQCSDVAYKRKKDREAKEAMARGDMLYAGKYSKPDYELLVSEKCSNENKNRMISHSPEVIEMLNDFGIPVMTEYSSYESHPLGRVEWIKFFGALRLWRYIN